MFIQAPQAPIMAFHFLFIFWAAVWNPCWKWRDHLFRNQEWEGSALELFKALQTLLITFKVVFLKALLNELCTQPLFKSIASNKFSSQRLNAKLFISPWQSQSLFCVVKKSNSSGIWGSVRLCPQPFCPWAHRLYHRAQTQARGRLFSHFYPHFDRQSLSSALFGYFSTSSLLSQWPGLTLRGLHSRRQPCFLWEIIRVLHRHSWFFPPWPKGAHKRSPKSTQALQPAAIQGLSSASVILGN